MRAYRRVIKRQRYRRSCQCEAAPALRTAPAPSRLIPKGILGISIWVTVLIDKYLLYRPTYRLLEDLRAHGLILPKARSPTVCGVWRRCSHRYGRRCSRSRRAEHWHADETSWQVFVASSEDACQRWCLWVFWSAEVVDAGSVPFGTGAEAAFCDRDRGRGQRRPLFIVQAVSEGHRVGAVVLLGACTTRLHHGRQRAGRARAVGRAVAG